jgi:alkanesulfonate monooxygenase SsuD/methylene tetrahydromethanopterin reductase-like flavin-dependent oxidoreductase (luciferase family)
MHFGLFVEEKRYGTTDEPSAFRDIFELADKADAWGADCIWLGEIHFTPARSVISASLQVATAIASRTRRVRVGSAVKVLPLDHPLRIAEEVATVDQLSQGRFEFGIGRSGVAASYDTYGVPYGESQARFLEALDIIRQAWRGEPFAYEGQFYKFKRALVAPRPYQVPHPPMRMAVTSGETFPAAGRMGVHTFIGLRLAEVPELAAQLATYRKAWHEAGHAGAPSTYLRIPVYVSETTRGAAEEPRESLTYFMERQSSLALAGAGRAGTNEPELRRAQAERMANLSYDEILQKKIIAGTPDVVIARLKEIRDALELDGVIAELNPGGRIPAALELKSFELLAREVMPALK